MRAMKHRHNLFGKLGLVVIMLIAAALWPEQDVFAQSETDTTIHIVSWGETVSSIAAKYGITVDSIVVYNHLAEIDRIYAGQQLIIPGNSGNPRLASGGERRTHIVQPGENLFRISLLYEVDIEALAAANDLPDENYLFVGQSLIIPSNSDVADTSQDAADISAISEHIVQPGETLSGISQMYGVSITAFQTANHLLNPALIFVGQRLAIPGAANAVSGGYTPQQASTTHIVQPGENLFAIAANYGVVVWVIVQSNNISNPSVIYSGQVLTIPIPNSLTTAQEASSGLLGKAIVVDVSGQRAYVYEDSVLIQTFIVSTGVPGQDTMRGSFQIQNKIPMAYAATWDLQMPYWLGFYWAGSLQNGFHALPILSNGVRLWEGFLGRPASYGCVILGEEPARWLYEWADIGTPVTVQD